MKIRQPSPSGVLLPILAASLLVAASGHAQVSTSGNELRLKPQTLDPAVTIVRPDIGKMISVLKGDATAEKPKSGDPKTSESSESKAGAAKPQLNTIPLIKPGLILERKTTISPQALPKGYQPVSPGAPMEIRKGRAPASGSPGEEEGPVSTTTLFMKKGNTQAEGRAEDPAIPPYSTRMKDARTPAEGIAPATLARPPAPQVPGDAHGAYRPVAVAHAAAPATELSYRVDSSSQLSTNTVKFLKNSTELADQASFDYLLTLASALQSTELAANRFVVEGHASAEGSDHANLLLSQRRANAIFDFLVSRGVSPVRLLAVGHGETHARFADHDPEYLRSQDRQVIVFKLAE